MRKILLTLVLAICVLTILGLLAWANRTRIAAHYLSKGLNGAPVSIGKMEYKKDTLYVDNFLIGNLRPARTKTAFSAKELDVEATLKDIRGEVMTIEDIEINNILLNIEYLNESKSRTNWDLIMQNDKRGKVSDRKYLIKNLTLKNLTIVVIEKNGKVTRYPTLSRMQFSNISDETGFPIEDIEKAIFDIMLKRVIQEYGLKILQDTLDQVIPQFAPNFPFSN